MKVTVYITLAIVLALVGWYLYKRFVAAAGPAVPAGTPKLGDAHIPGLLPTLRGIVSTGVGVPFTAPTIVVPGGPPGGFHFNPSGV